MAKFRVETAVEGKWSREVHPAMSGYRMACCDCDLVHDMEFHIERVIRRHPDGSYDSEKTGDKDLIVVFKVARNNRSTAALRRKKK